MTDDLNKIKPVKFPVIWLTYKQRIKRDLDRANATEDGEKFFTSDYLTRLSAQATQLDQGLLKLMALQLALTAFQVIGFVGNDASISLFGITLKQATGVKELLLALYCFIAAAAWMVIISRDTALAVIERLTELSTTDVLGSFGKLAAPSSFGLKFYVPRSYDDWIFPTRANTAAFVIFSTLALLLMLAIWSFSLAVNVFFVLDIYRHPTLGVWSKFVLIYVGLTVVFGVLFIVRFYIPLPYKDQSILLDLKALESADPALHIRRQAEIFGPLSKYRRFSWSYYWKLALSRIPDAFLSTKSRLLASLGAWRRRIRTARRTRDNSW